MLTRHNYNSLSDDIKTFCSFTGIRTISEFAASSGSWDYLKLLGKERSNIKMNQFTDGVYADVTFSSLEANSTIGAFFVNELARFRQSIHTLKPRFNQRSVEFWKELEEIVMKKLIKSYVDGSTVEVDESIFHFCIKKV